MSQLKMMHYLTHEMSSSSMRGTPGWTMHMMVLQSDMLTMMILRPSKLRLISKRCTIPMRILILVALRMYTVTTARKMTNITLERLLKATSVITLWNIDTNSGQTKCQ